VLHGKTNNYHKFVSEQKTNCFRIFMTITRSIWRKISFLMQKFFLWILAISQKNQYFDKLLCIFLIIVMQILKQFGFLFQIQTCNSYLFCHRAPVTEYDFGRRSPAPSFCKKKFFNIFLYSSKLCTIYNYKEIFICFLFYAQKNFKFSLSFRPLDWCYSWRVKKKSPENSRFSRLFQIVNIQYM